MRRKGKIKISKAFVRGFSRGLDMSGHKNWIDLGNSREKDIKALRGDWENVGRSIRKEAAKLSIR